MAGKKLGSRVQARINGLVQGVCYRMNTVRTAESLGLTGWVRNCPDGSVELVAEGDRAQLEQLIQWCRRGPSFSEVDRVEESWEEAKGEFPGFTIRY